MAACLLHVIVASVSASIAGCGDDLVSSQLPGCPENGGKDATTLHLKPGETARHGPAWGAGLIEETIETDVFVAGGGSAGTSAAIAAARTGAKTVSHTVFLCLSAYLINKAEKLPVAYLGVTLSTRLLFHLRSPVSYLRSSTCGLRTRIPASALKSLVKY